MDTEVQNETVERAIEPQEEVVENSDVQPSQENAQEIVPQEDKEIANIRRMRLSKEAAEKERDEAYRKLKEYQSYADTSKKPESQDEDLDINISDDDLVEGKHLGKVAKKIKKLEEKINVYEKNTTAATVETQLRNKYSDFDKVVSKENVDALSRDYPELANTLSSCKDLYSQAVSAYTMIKRMGVYKEDKFVNDRALAEQNASKPRPLTSMSPQQGESPLSRANAFANGLTDELKAELVKEMMEARSRR